MKAEKDRQQAAQILAVMLEDLPDAVAEAHALLAARGKGWTDRMNRALRKLAGEYPQLADLSVRH